MSNVLVEKNKLDILANAISNKSGEPLTLTLDEMVEAVDGIDTEVNLQEKQYSVNKAGQELIQADNGYDGLSNVIVNVPMGSVGIATTGNFRTINGKLYFRFYADAGVSSNNDMGAEGYITDDTLVSNYSDYPAVPTGTSVTPTESAQTIGGMRQVMESAVTVNAIPSNYVGSGITQRSSSDLSASGATVTVPSGYYSTQATKSVATGTAGTPTATKGTVSNHSISVTPSVTNTTGYITGSTKTGTAVTVSASELVSGSQTFTSNNTYDVTNLASVVVNVSGGSGGGGGGGKAKVETATATPSSASTSISFTGLLGEPTSFAVVSNADLATGASPWKTAAVVFDGTSLHGQTIRNTSNAQVTYDGSGFTKTYNNGTLTITGSGTNFQANQYKLIYTYGNTTIGTAETQVGSGATSVTFTGVTDEPAYFSCIFKSNFSTSSGYQRVIVVANDGTSTYGMEMDSSAKVSTIHWSYNYNNGSLTITSQGTNAGGYFHQPGYYQLTYAAGGGDEIILQDKTVTPTESTQYITADEDYTGLGMVTVNAISSTYVGSGISQRSSTDVTASGATVTIPAGYYSTQVAKSVTSGSAGTPTASKGTVSNNSISITPSVTNTTGYITGGTKTGTAVTVSASELVSGNKSITANGTNIDVTNYATVSVDVASTAPTIQSLSITPSTSEQTFNSSSVDGYKPVTVAAMPSLTLPTSTSSSATSGYTSKATITPSTSDQYINIGTGYNGTTSYYKINAMATMTLPTAVSTTSSGTSKATLSLTGGTRYLNIPTGYNGTAQYYTLSVANGSATGPSSITQSSATVSTGTNTLTLTKTGVSTTPTVSAGYVSSATSSTATVTLTASVTTKAATTYHPSATAQSISSGTYLTGAQTIAAVTTSNLSASNIVSGVTIKVGDSSDDDCVASVTGNVVLQNYYTGSSAPSSSTGSNGDLYLQS